MGFPERATDMAWRVQVDTANYDEREMSSAISK